jgi:hypothetical protein
MRSPGNWFFMLATVCVVAPYLLGLRPTTVRQRHYVSLTIAFLAWILLLMTSLRSR